MLLYRKRHIDHETGLFLRLTSLHFSANLEKEWQYSFFFEGGGVGWGCYNYKHWFRACLVFRDIFC